MRLNSEIAGLLKRSIVWDNHGCMPHHDTMTWLQKLETYRQGNVNVAMINLGDSFISLEQIVRMAAHIRNYVQLHPNEYLLLQSTEDIVRAKAEDKIAIGLDIEGAFSIGDQLSMIQLYYDLGVRWMSMVYNRRNLIGSGCHDDIDEGLTEFGRNVVREMDRVGIVKCCSHTGYRTAMEVLTASGKPTIFSHSNPRALVDHPRNIPDELIDACAATDGVICINGVGLFLSKNNEAHPTLVARHMDYVAQRVGSRHVGLGLDYVFDQGHMNSVLEEHAGTWPTKWGYRPGIAFLAPSEVPAIANELLRLGWQQVDVENALGGNLMRVAVAVWN